MYKNLSIALLIVAFGPITARSAGLPPSTSASPVIVAKQKLINRTGPILARTIFTPVQDGVYRLSAYATVTQQADPSSRSSWEFGVGWTDDAVTENPYPDFYGACGCKLGPFSGEGLLPSGFTIIVEAKAGTPITYSMSQVGPPDNSAYSLYYVLEQIE